MNSPKSPQHVLGSLAPEALERMVYLVGSARGGTTVSLHLIGAHPEILGFHGPSHFINQIWRYRNVVHNRLLKVIFWANALIDREAMMGSLDEDRREIANRIYNQAFARCGFRAMHDLYPLFYALDPAREVAPDRYRAWFDKGNDANGIDDLAKYYPEAKFLFIVRDPRSAIATLAKVQAGRVGKGSTIRSRDVLSESIYWRNFAQRCMRFAARNPERALLYSYERLVTEPADTLRAIFDFVDLSPLDEGALTGIIDGIGFGSNWGGGGSGLKLEPIVRWRSVLPPEIVDLIAEICGPTARKLGYHIPAPTHRRGWVGVTGLEPGLVARSKVVAKRIYLWLAEQRVHQADLNGSAGRLLWSPDRETALDARLSESEASL
jgi:hypothetical protein